MSFQQALDLDDTLAFLDAFDLSAADTPEYYCSSSSSNNSSSPCCTDDSISSLLSELTGSEHEVSELATTPPREKRSREDATHQPPLQQLTTTACQRPKKVAPTSRATPRDAAATAALSPAATELKARKPRKQNRTEILQLREQLKELQARHAKLQKRGSGRPHRQMYPSSTATVGSKLLTTSNTPLALIKHTTDQQHSKWLDFAVEHYTALQQSEALNRRLRDAIAKQTKITTGFQALLQRKFPLQKLDLMALLEFPPVVPATTASSIQLLSPLPQAERLLTELCQSVESQFHETDLVCHGISLSDDTSTVFSTSRTKQKPVCGPTFELTTNTPVSNSDFQVLGDMMWQRIVETNRFPVVDSRTIPQLAERTAHLLAFDDSRVRIALPSKFGERLHVDGTVTIGRFQEAQRIVITVTAVYTVSESDLLFRESAWVVVSKEKAGAASSSLFQTFYRLHSERRDDTKSPTGSVPLIEKALDERTEYVRELVMKSLSDQIRQHMTRLQDLMLSEVVKVTALDSVKVLCPLIKSVG